MQSRPREAGSERHAKHTGRALAAPGLPLRALQLSGAPGIARKLEAHMAAETPRSCELEELLQEDKLAGL